ncbi:hypothetical protein HID58_077453 [Brassica napus]|uniref:Uncharacterized protein n=1 Tax=Brassica napus TaxID=3708 RepID=A0ABQ7YT90_BRANA|nr:hypothetical protein HID58_077453 [Brassica napus]
MSTRVNNNMDSFLILLKIERSLFSGEERNSALIIYPNELSKAAQLSLAKAKSFKERCQKQLSENKGSNGKCIIKISLGAPTGF